MKPPKPAFHPIVLVLLVVLLNFSPVVVAGDNDPDLLTQRDVPVETLAKGFKDPPAEARPFVRWWWNDNRVEGAQVLRELDALKDVGIGGVEINPVGAREEDIQSKVEPLVWRSKEWDEVLHVASKGARERGMIVDLIAGSGWPFGGRFLAPDEQIMRLTSVDRKVTGPQVVQFAWDDISEAARKSVRHGDQGEVELHFVKLYPTGIEQIGQMVDLTEEVQQGNTLSVQVPEGEYVVSLGILQKGYRHVMVGAAGADGPSMDHYQRTVTRSYLNRLKGVEETWGEPLSTYVRAIFCDSIETAASNWTHGMLDSFQTTMGYNIEPYLPLVLKEETEEDSAFNLAFLDEIRRARYDWTKFLAHTFLDNFTREFAQFCRDNNLLSRYQAYGVPWLIAMAEGYMIPDIPESNNWIRMDPYEEDRFTHDLFHGYMVWNKYASAAGRLNNRRIVSIEAMTTVAERFERTLSTIKQADDMNFITGMTHSVLHGFNTVPEDIPFPGLVRFGTFFSEFNPWWPYLHHWVNYNARLSYIMQNTRSTAEIAIIGPTPDLWSRTSMARMPFHVTPDYLHLLWEPISQLGADCDYLHADIIENADVSEGHLRFGSTAFEVLIVTEMETMRPDTVEAIQRFAEGGGKVVFVGTLPTRSPGLLNVKDNEARITQAVAASLEAGALQVNPPTDTSDLRTWVTMTLEQLGFEFSLRVEEPRDGLYQLRKKANGEDVIFITNTYQLESSRTRVGFELGERGLWRWDPETGERTPYDLPYDTRGFQIDLRPVESILLVTGKKQLPEHPRRVSRDDVSSLAIGSPWTVDFYPVNEDRSFTMTMPELLDFSQSDDERLVHFSGTAIYKTNFRLIDLEHTQLHLGWDNAFVSEVFINGHTAGVNWYGSKLFDLGAYLKTGENVLMIKYTTTLNNKLKAPESSGLIGPVRLLGHD